MKNQQIELATVALIIMYAVRISWVYAEEIPVSCYVNSTNKSFRCGDGVNSTSNDTVIIGSNVTASGERAIVIGSIDHIGNRNTKATADGIAVGSGAIVDNNAVGGIAIGSRFHDSRTGIVYTASNYGGATVNAINGIAIGASAVAGSVGKNNFRTVAIGDLANVSGNLNIGLGSGLIVGDGSERSISIGYGSAIGRTGRGSHLFENVSQATVVGTSAEVMKGADKSSAFGSDAVVLQGVMQSIALGNNTTINTGGHNSTAIGSYASIGTKAINAIALGGGVIGIMRQKQTAFLLLLSEIKQVR
ncbi:hypothetical protein CKG84_19240 [Salmonella enterica subsp. enterica serovar Newport]|nr:hypothetical protein [Salmonella enterica subsp. enterica serovar Newport]